MIVFKLYSILMPKAEAFQREAEDSSAKSEVHVSTAVHKPKLTSQSQVGKILLLHQTPGTGAH